MAFTNPIGTGLSPERIDMGVDYGGSGPLYALGSGTIANLFNSGWPGGNFLTIHLDSGQYVYYAEDIQPLVKTGQRVSAGQHIANATGGSSGIEIGWAAPPGTGETMAASAGQQSKSGDPGSVSTAFGQLMSQVIAAAGGQPGKLQGAVSGTIPSSFGITPTQSATLTSITSPIGGLFSIPGEILSFFSDADKFVNDVLGKLVWLVQPSSWVRIGAFFAGMLLLIGAVIVFTKTDTKVNIQPVPVPV